MHYLKHVGVCFLALVLSIQAYAVKDSLGIKEEDGQKFIMHRVDKGQTLFAISQRYDVSVDQLKETNPQTEDELVVGEVILVPLRAAKQPKGKFHTVEKGETLFSIAQQYDADLAKIKEWNDLESNNIEVGQKLKIAPASKEDDKAPEKPENSKEEPDSKKPAEKDKSDKHTSKQEKGEAEDSAKAGASQTKPDSVAKTDSAQSKSELAKKFRETQETKSEVKGSGNLVSKTQEGKATWLSNIESEKSLALHRSAPPGTIIKVTNLVNDEVVYVKTVGKLNQNEDDAMLITISPKAAEKLNVSDDFFRAKLEYSYRKTQN